MSQIEERLEEIAKLIQSDQDETALRLHVEQVLDSPAFSSSRRSGQFLQYVVDKAIAQQTEALKERTIGVQVFHRPPGYDTGDDAVVRVTASDVRRRLAQHYSKEGRSSEFRISLPPGGYAPEISRDLPPTPSHIPVKESLLPFIAETAPAADPLSGWATSGPITPEVVENHSPGAVPWRFKLRSSRIAVAATLLLGLCAAVGTMLFRRDHVQARTDDEPWALLFSSERPLYVVLADPDLNEIQLLTGKSVSLSEYANGKLGCETLAPELQIVCRSALRGDKVATVDANAIAKIGALAGSYKSSLEPHAAREIRLTDLQTDRNLLLMGSRRANPWTDLFRDKLDFYVGHDDASGLQVVHTVHRRPGEAEQYIPTAGPYGTGENYSLISFLHNLNGSGYAMLLTGATHEGMDAAVDVVTDKARFTRILKDCGIRSGFVPFQILLKLRMMAGSSLTTEVLACHTLSPT